VEPLNPLAQVAPAEGNAMTAPPASNPPSQARVVAVIPTLNRREEVVRCVRSLLDSERRPDSLVLIDNGSTDGVADAFRHEIAAHDFQGEVLVRTFASALGSSGAYTEAIRTGRSLDVDLVWLLDNDAFVAPDALKHLLEAHQRFPKAALAPFCLVPETTRSCWNLELPAPWGNRSGDISDLRQHDVVPAKMTIYAGLLLPVAVIDAVGEPDSRFFFWFDDSDYTVRVVSAGFGLYYVTEASIYHPASPVEVKRILGRPVLMMRTTGDRRYYHVRNILLFYGKHKQWSRLGMHVGKQVVNLLSEDDLRKAWPDYRDGWRDFLTSRFGQRQTT
jgi:rhamnopyranosyl-N-acetylglucosaminyl-diphospho-decaprenol beta-1,3/1,4-galactofuranosyltransferase